MSTLTPAQDVADKPAEEGVSGSSVKANLNVLPDEQTVAAAAEILVFDEQGGKLPFGNLFASGKTIVVFIREC